MAVEISYPFGWEFKSDQTINFKLDATTWTVNYDYCSDEEVLQTSSDITLQFFGTYHSLYLLLSSNPK